MFRVTIFGHLSQHIALTLIGVAPQGTMGLRSWLASNEGDDPV